MKDEPKKPLYTRAGLESPDTPLVKEPEKAPTPELTPEQIDRRLAVLDKIGTRIMRLDMNVGLAVVFPDVEPSEKAMRALAELRMDLPVVILKTAGVLESYHLLIPRGWLGTWEKQGWRKVGEIIRHAVTQIG